MVINWAEQYAGSSNQVVTWCSAVLLERNWRWCTDAYLAPHLLRCKRGQENRYEMHSKRLPAGLKCDIAEGGFADIDIVETLGGSRALHEDGPRPDKVVGFSDGRHRVRWCIDHGVEAVPIYFNRNDVPLARALFGIDQQASILPADYAAIGEAGRAAVLASPPVQYQPVAQLPTPPDAIDISTIPPVSMRSWHEKLFAWLDRRR